MKIGIMTINDLEFHPNKRLAEAASQRGHQVSLINPYRLWCSIQGGKLGSEGWPGLDALDVVLPRQGAPIGDYGLALIRHLMLMGIPVVNDEDVVRLTRNQFLTLQALVEAEVPVPDSIFVTTEEGFSQAVDLLGGYPVVAKKVNSWGGRGIILVENERILQLVSDCFLEERQGLVVQYFIPPAGRQDLRVLVLGDQVVGAMQLRPKDGDFRANFHLGGEAQIARLSPEMIGLAVKAGEAVGLEIAGVDIIVDREGQAGVIEINHSPGFKGLEGATGLDIAGLIVDYVANTYGRAQA